MPAPVHIGRRENGFSDPSRSPLLHPALSNSLSRSFGLNSPFSLSALSSSLTMLSSSPSFSTMGMSLGRSFEERPKLEAQFFRNFSCCGLDLQDLHGLLEHFEECHVAFDDPDLDMDLDHNGSDGTISGPPSPRLHATSIPPPQDASMDLDMEMDDVPPPPSSSFEPHPLKAKKFSAAMNPLRGASSSSASSASGTTAAATTAAATTATAATGATVGVGGVVSTLSGGVDLGPGRPLHHHQQHHHPSSSSSSGRPSLPSTPAEILSAVHDAGDSPGLFGAQPGLAPNVGLAPSLLFPGTPADSPPSDAGSLDAASHSSSGRESDPGPASPSSSSAHHHHHQHQHHVPLASLPAAAALQPSQISALHPLGTGIQISPSGRPYTPPSEKPFKCSVPGCDKSYKQQNGLKYHRLHGHCNQNNVGRDGDKDRGEGKPYVCHVVSCGKRYKNMNGLRYHYQHSGSHGALGLQMLAQAVHPPPQFPPGHKRAGGSSNGGTPGSSRDASPAGFPRMGMAGMGMGVGVGMGIGVGLA